MKPVSSSKASRVPNRLRANLRANVSSLALAALLAACAPAANPNLVPPPEVYSTTGDTKPFSGKQDFNPQVDVIVVMDNSESTDGHQTNMQKNAERFAEAFKAHEKLDFHIGVVSVFDSKHQFEGNNKKEFYPIGKLRRLKAPKDFSEEQGQVLASGPQYITRQTPRFSEVLGETLKIGVHKLKDGGPQWEESFAPVVAALDGRNQGFLRPNAHLSVVFVTDANDSSPISPEKFYRTLLDLKGGDSDKISTFGVLALQEGFAASEQCKMDQSGPPKLILEFLKLSGGKAYNLCDRDFGSRLAEVGRIIQQKATRTQFQLKAIPEYGTLKVWFGDKRKEHLLPEDKNTGWTYDPATNSIIISGEAQLKGEAGAQIQYEFTRVDPVRVQRGRAKSVRVQK